ncbi:MAG TPA: ChbG/HpnK family deacetylase, partial [Xanthobacteraceae bacterium]|nr:ChbG/HpnK family deacetylase [Xanthobacteraceae bacterium]
MRRIVLCADDYALSPGVSAGIRELLAAGRLNATSVM